MSDHWTLRPTSGTLVVVCQIGTESFEKGHFSLVEVTWGLGQFQMQKAAVQEEEDDRQTLRRLGGLKDQLSDSSSFHLPVEPASDPAKAEAKAKDDAEEEEAK